MTLRHRHTVLATLLSWGSISAAAMEAQQGATFTQLADLGSNIGPRLTQSVTRARIDRLLFSRIDTKVSFIQNGLVYELATDPEWGRVLVGLWDEYINEYTNGTGPGGRLLRPYGIDISARRFVYIADRERRRVLVTVFNPSVKNLTGPLNISMPGTRPIDVAWDGTSAPLSNDYLYVLDASLSRVSYWNFNATPSSPLSTYGSVGSGTGQFLRPTGICVEKRPGANGGTQFSTQFYVVDRGNKRVVRLGRNGTTISWGTVYTRQDWDPADCTVDHFGHLYVTDAMGHRILKFNSALSLLDSYGSYGTGPNSLNTFASPGAISVPCGLKTVGATTVWYCEGRIITAERWSENTGAVEHWLGVKSWFYQNTPNSEQSAYTMFTTTDVANVSGSVSRQNSGTVYTLPPRLVGAGTNSYWWDGKDNAGKPVPDGYYRFNVTIKSAYGCPNNFAYPWCHTTLHGNYFFFHYCVPDGGGGPAALEPEPNALPGPPTCGNSVAAASSTGPVAGIPPAFAVRQLPGRVEQVPAGLSQLATNPGLRPSMSVAGQPISAQPSLITETREAGVTALQINLPSRESVRIRIVDLQGRLIRTDRIAHSDPGVLVYRWDGRDDQGRKIQRGVYIAQVDAGNQSARTKLIVTATPD
jgi:flagellar hook assembly protein FlgD